MAKSGAVWGIDIGQCALKALRCRPHDKEEKRMVVEAFDYIEYPKILTQPEANREELIKEAIEVFERQLGLSHPETLRALNLYISVLRAAGRNEEARVIEARASHQESGGS